MNGFEAIKTASAQPMRRRTWNTGQVRIRLPKELGRELKKYSPEVRGYVLQALWLQKEERLEVHALVQMRGELSILAALLRQSLEARAGGADYYHYYGALRRCIRLLDRLVKP